MNPTGGMTRRNLVKTAAFGGAIAGAPMILKAQDKAGAKTFKIGLIGCGGRGRGAALQSIEAGKQMGYTVECVGVADWFKDRAEAAGKRLEVRADRCFGGPTAYQQLVETDAQIILIAGPPLFRPNHLEAAIKAGKHAFIEKPVAVDPPGCRKVIALGEEAKKKGLAVVSGTEMRHEFEFRNTHQAVVVEKQLGKLYGGRIAFCIAQMFSPRLINPKTADDMIRTWQNWICLSGDHLVEQHVHNVDIANWFCGRPPVSAVGFGGRARRVAGDMYDFFSVDFDYGDNLHIHSMCRQVNGCWNWVGHDFAFEKGPCNGRNGPPPHRSSVPDDLPKARSSGHQEQTDVLYHVNRGDVLDQARAVAESTATAILGRTSAYTGKQMFWEEMMASPTKRPDLYNLTLKPSAEDFEKGTVEIPKEAAPVPGA